MLRDEPLVSPQEAFAIERSRAHGHVEAVIEMMRRLGVPELIAARRSRERDLVVAMIAERLIAPCSKLATTRLWHTTTLAETLAVGDADEDELYAAMDWLGLPCTHKFRWTSPRLLITVAAWRHRARSSGV